MTSQKHQRMLDQILHAIAHEDVVLPALPGAASEILSLMDAPNASANQIMDVISGDPFISAQLVGTANGAAFADKPQARTVRVAASRLGFHQLRNLVLSIAQSRMQFPNNPVLHKRMAELAEHSREVAMVSYVLALRYPHLSPDQAMLAGLVHDIGILPLCLHIEKNHAQVTEEALDEMICQCHSAVGAALLKKWNFPQELVDVAAQHEHPNGDGGDMGRANYSDVVYLANRQNRNRNKMIDWDKSEAVQRLALNEQEYRMLLTRHADYLALVDERQRIKPKTFQIAHPSQLRPQQHLPTTIVLSAKQVWYSLLKAKPICIPARSPIPAIFRQAI